MEAPIVQPVVTTVAIPAGTLGLDPVSFEVRCFVVSGPTGLVLIDTCPPGTSELIGRAIASVGADWTEVTDIVLTHRHFDHTGGLVETASLAPTARLWAGADDAPAIPFEGDRNVRPLVDGQLVGTLRVFDTPGHTPGHVSLLHEEESVLLLGDLVGSRDGILTIGPPAFTADLALNLASLGRMVALNPDRFLFSHGEEVADPAEAIRAFLARS